MAETAQVPNGAKVGIGLAGAGALSWVAMAAEDWRVVLSMLPVAILAVGVVITAYALIKKWRRNKEGAKVGRAMQANAREVPHGATADGQALLDDLRRRFEEGVARFQKTGKSLYDLPWYMVVGERASGKSELIRRGTADFRPGFQDPLLGIGGTVNMNWWFTNHGVLLDTAGALMLPEVRTGKNEAWDKFLDLLLTRRWKCPINGLVLVIPADTLLTDPVDQVNAKAAQIAQRFEEIQERFGIRFPVFVVITKCDKVNGFREFCERIPNHTQMLGWSNPAPLEQPFSPDAVTEHLRRVHDQLVRRRYRMLRDPVHSSDASARRLDEVDALFEFPEELLRIAPGLRRYLEPIFVAGTFFTKPLFLRGIYFTSSLQTGQALDVAISKAVGHDVKQLLGGPICGEKQMFLRDVFLEKVFREKGLVTRSSNTDELRRKRKLIVIGSVMTGVAALLGITVWQFSALTERVKKYEPYWTSMNANTPQSWAVVRDNGWNEEDWERIVKVHAEAGEAINRNLEPPAIFRPVASVDSDKFIRDGRQAYRSFYEATVLMPLVKQAAKHLLKDKAFGEKDKSTDALRQIIGLAGGAPPATMPTGSEQTPIHPLVEYLQTRFGKQRPRDDVATLAAAYRLAYRDVPWSPPQQWNAVADVEGGVAAFRDYWEAQVNVTNVGEAETAEADLSAALRAHARAQDQAFRITLPQPPPMRLEEADAFAARWAVCWKGLEDTKRTLDDVLDRPALKAWHVAGDQIMPLEFLHEQRTQPFRRRAAAYASLRQAFSPSHAANSPLRIAWMSIKDAPEKLNAELPAPTEHGKANGAAPPATQPSNDILTIQQRLLALPNQKGHPYSAIFKKHESLTMLLKDSASVRGRGLKAWDEYVDDQAELAVRADELGEFIHKLAARRGRHAVLTRILSEDLKTPVGWSEAVKSKATGVRGMAEEASLSALMGGGNPQYDVEACEDLRKEMEWGDVTDFFSSGGGGGAADVLDAKELSDRYKSCKTAYDQYDKSLKEYWRKAPSRLLTEKNATWASCHDSLNQLVDQRERVEEYLARVEGKAAAEFVDDDTVKTARDKVEEWAKLDVDPVQARHYLLRMKWDPFINGYTHTTTLQATRAERYWSDLTLEALAALVRDARKDASEAYTRLDTDFNRFPFANKRGAPNIRVDELGELRKCLERLSPPADCDAEALGKADPAKGALPRPWANAVGALISPEGNGPQAAGQRRARVEYVRKMLDLVDTTKGRAPLRCSISVENDRGAGDSKSAWGISAWWRLWYGKDEQQSADRNLEPLQTIAKDLEVHRGPLDLHLYQDVADFRRKDANKAIPFPLAEEKVWACFRLLEGAVKSEESPGKYHVTKTLMTKAFGTREVKLVIEFTAAGWKPNDLPDFSTLGQGAAQ